MPPRDARYADPKIRCLEVLQLLVDIIVGGGARWVAGLVLALLTTAAVWQAIESESRGTGYIALGFGGIWLAIELMLFAWRHRRRSRSVASPTE